MYAANSPTPAKIDFPTARQQSACQLSQDTTAQSFNNFCINVIYRFGGQIIFIYECVCDLQFELAVAYTTCCTHHNQLKVPPKTHAMESNFVAAFLLTQLTNFRSKFAKLFNYLRHFYCHWVDILDICMHTLLYVKLCGYVYMCVCVYF